jgi:hypothetical protein
MARIAKEYYRRERESSLPVALEGTNHEARRDGWFGLGYGDLAVSCKIDAGRGACRVGGDRTAVQNNAGNVEVYATVLSGGMVRRGDAVRLN